MENCAFPQCIRVISAFKQSADVLLAVIVADISFLGLITVRVQMNQIVALNYRATLNTRLHYAPVCDLRKTLHIVIIVITLLISIQLLE